MKVLILGSTGMLGSECRRVFAPGNEVITPDRKNLDIISWDGVIENLQESEPDIVINCAAYTDVDACETEDFAVRKINVEGPRNLAQCSARFGCKLIHISSDYVFDGRKMLPQPYFEDDALNPLSAYGKSKLESEKAVRENAPDYILLRTGWLYGINGGNFIKSVIAKGLGKAPLRVVEDQYGSPTWTYRLALQIKKLVEKEGRGTYHATAEGFCNRFECARYIVKKLGLPAPVEPCRMEDLKNPAARPGNCIMENRLLKRQGICVMREWKRELGAFLRKHGKTMIEEAEKKIWEAESAK